jgi:uncharacterized membrane protein
LAVTSVAAVCAGLSIGVKRVSWPLAMGYAVQSAILLIVALPVALSGLWLVIGWMALALAFSVLGMVLDRRISRIAGMVTWLLAAGDALGHSSGLWGVHANTVAWINVAGQGITPALAACWVVALVGQAIAWLTRTPEGDDRPEHGWSWFMSAAAVLLFAAASMQSLSLAWATMALVALAWILALADIGSDRMSWSVQGIALLLLASAKWVAIDLLADRLSPQWQSAAQVAWFNPTMGMAVILAASLPAMYWARRSSLHKALNDAGKSYQETTLIYAICFMVIALLTAGLSLQLDLVVHQAGDLRWPRDQYEQLLLTILWTAASAALWAAGKWADRTTYIESRSLGAQRLSAVLACKFLLFDTLFWNLFHPSADVAVLFNAQTLAGAVLVAVLAVQWRRGRNIFMRRFSGFLSILILLWIGTMEVDRAFDHAFSGQFTDPGRAREVAISIFWAIFAVACVVWGFRIRVAPLRYFGLGLFGVTLAKILFVDMGEVGAGYRILSFMGVGVLLLGTSVLYGKLGPRLLSEAR